MITSRIQATFPCDVGKVWQLVTSVDDAEWRSDIAEIEPDEDGNGFTEYTAKGRATHFNVTVREPCRRYEFDLENDVMSGRWSGQFSYQKGVTTVEFIESVAVKKLFPRLFARAYLKKQQARYIADLKAALGL